jgi:glycosyltransferase involved in cell wall biosynthesis
MTFEAACLAAAIARAAADDATITTRTIGRGGSYRNAAFAAMALRFGREPLFDVIHAFDASAALAAFASPPPVIFTPTRPLPPSTRWLGPAMVYRNGTAITTSQAARRDLTRRGAPPFRCDVLRPPIRLEPISALQRSQLRLSLGISPERRVLLAPGESVRSAGHLLAVHTASILHVLDERYCLLLSGRGHCLGSCIRLANNLHQPRVLVVAEKVLGHTIAFEELVGTADAALIPTSDSISGLPLAVCMAAGLPIVTSSGPLADELLQDGATALVAPKPGARMLAQRILRLFDEPGLAAHLGRATVEEARRLFDAQTQAQQYLSLYQRAAGILPKSGALSPEDHSAAIAASVAG